MTQRNPAMKLIASAVVFTFLVTNLGINQQTFAATGVPAGEVPFLTAGALAIPAELGQVTDTVTGDPAAPAFIHIQSAHGNYQAEKNIEKLLGYIEKNSSVKLLLLEGAASKLQPELFRMFPKHPDFNRKVTDKLMQEGYLTGPERFLIENADDRPQTTDHRQKQNTQSLRAAQTAKQSEAKRHLERSEGSQNKIAAVALKGLPRNDSISVGMEGYGIEDLDAYKKDRDAFISVIKKERAAEKFLGSLRASIDKRFSAKLNKDLLNLVRQEEALGSGTVSFEAWLKLLGEGSKKHLKQDLSDAFYQDQYPFLIRYYRLQAIGSKIDRDKALKEMDGFIKELEKRKIAKEIIHDFRATNQGPRATNSESPDVDRGPWNVSLGTSGYSPLRRAFDLAFNKLPKDFSMAQWLDWTLYAQHVILMQELEAKGLQDETGKLKNRILQALAQTPAEKEYLTEVRRLYLLRRLFSLELTRSEYEELKSGASDVGPRSSLRDLGTGTVDPKIAPVFQAAMQFYSVAVVRENKMFSNALRRMSEQKERRAVIVTGGFHAEGLKKLARDKNCSYIQITPRITEISRRDHEVYLRSILGSRDVETSQMSGLLALVDHAQRVAVTGVVATQGWIHDVRELILGLITLEPVSDQPVLSQVLSGSILGSPTPVLVPVLARAEVRSETENQFQEARRDQTPTLASRTDTRLEREGIATRTTSLSDRTSVSTTANLSSTAVSRSGTGATTSATARKSARRLSTSVPTSVFEKVFPVLRSLFAISILRWGSNVARNGIDVNSFFNNIFMPNAQSIAGTAFRSEVRLPANASVAGLTPARNEMRVLPGTVSKPAVEIFRKLALEDEQALPRNWDPSRDVRVILGNPIKNYSQYVENAITELDLLGFKGATLIAGYGLKSQDVQAGLLPEWQRIRGNVNPALAARIVALDDFPGEKDVSNNTAQNIQTVGRILQLKGMAPKHVLLIQAPVGLRGLRGIFRFQWNKVIAELKAPTLELKNPDEAFYTYARPSEIDNVTRLLTQGTSETGTNVLHFSAAPSAILGVLNDITKQIGNFTNPQWVGKFFASWIETLPVSEAQSVRHANVVISDYIVQQARRDQWLNASLIAIKILQPIVIVALFYGMHRWSGGEGSSGRELLRSLFFALLMFYGIIGTLLFPWLVAHSDGWGEHLTPVGFEIQDVTRFLSMFRFLPDSIRAGRPVSLKDVQMLRAIQTHNIAKLISLGNRRAIYFMLKDGWLFQNGHIQEIEANIEALLRLGVSEKELNFAKQRTIKLLTDDAWFDQSFHIREMNKLVGFLTNLGATGAEIAKTKIKAASLSTGLLRDEGKPLFMRLMQLRGCTEPFLLPFINEYRKGIYEPISAIVKDPVDAVSYIALALEKAEVEITQAQEYDEYHGPSGYSNSDVGYTQHVVIEHNEKISLAPAIEEARRIVMRNLQIQQAVGIQPEILPYAQLRAETQLAAMVRAEARTYVTPVVPQVSVADTSSLKAKLGTAMRVAANTVSPLLSASPVYASEVAPLLFAGTVHFQMAPEVPAGFATKWPALGKIISRLATASAERMVIDQRQGVPDAASVLPLVTFALYNPKASVVLALVVKDDLPSPGLSRGERDGVRGCVSVDAFAKELAALSPDGALPSNFKVRAFASENEFVGAFAGFYNDAAPLGKSVALVTDREDSIVTRKIGSRRHLLSVVGAQNPLKQTASTLLAADKLLNESIWSMGYHFVSVDKLGGLEALMAELTSYVAAQARMSASA